MSLREDRDQKLHEVDELKKALGAVQRENIDALKTQVLSLTSNVTKLERNLNAKQVFCESVVTENERLKEMMDMVKNEKITEVSTLKRALGELTRTQSDIKDIMSGVDSGDDGADGKIEVWCFWSRHLLLFFCLRISLSSSIGLFAKRLS